MRIKFTKMSGAGNDFVFLGPECARLVPRLSEVARTLCRRRLSVGADGLVLVDQGPAGILMRYFNSDGSEASFCGNGARCLVRYCVVKGIASGRIKFTSGSGEHWGEVGEGGVTVDMAAPVLVGRTVVGVGGRDYDVRLIEAGVPHAVILGGPIGGLDVARAGREIRHHSAFMPGGANVDFVDSAGGAPFGLRTYERGVEKETLACGSGCVASALALRLEGLAGAEVALKVASGDVLTVRLPGEGGGQASLAGPAVVVYEGEIDL
ncbi:MAG: diaminopimelate epimerase [bacterium]